MITQTIKHWLSHLFAWWPWKRRVTTAHVPPRKGGAMRLLREQLWSASSNESLPQTGAGSVAVEQGNDDATQETTLPRRLPPAEHGDRATQFPTLRDISSPPRLSQDEKTLENLTLSNAQFTSDETTLTPISEQQMAFLQYLVSHGLLNEGFEEGKVPEQYRRKRMT